MRIIPRRLALPLLALAASLHPAAARPPAVPRPALWKIERGPATIYLFGTIHMLPQGYAWHGKAIDAALGRSQSLALEVVADQDPNRIAAAFTALAPAKGLPPLLDRVPPRRRVALAALIAQADVPAAALDRMKTWAAAVMLTGAAMSRIGLEAGSGIEPQLSALFRAAGKPIGELETPAQQLSCFDALPEAAQRAFLVQTLDDPAKSRADFHTMLDAWSRGDVAGIARAFAEDPEFTPEVRDQLVRRRDALWAAVLAKRLERPGISFVAVGAGHLVGPDSVQAMLARSGIRAVRVQ